MENYSEEKLQKDVGSWMKIVDYKVQRYDLGHLHISYRIVPSGLMWGISAVVPVLGQIGVGAVHAGAQNYNIYFDKDGKKHSTLALAKSHSFKDQKTANDYFNPK